MAIGHAAIGQFAVGQGKEADFGTINVFDLTTGSPAFDTPAFSNLGIDSKVKLLLHGDGSNASTTIIDSSPSAHTMTAHNSAQLTTSGPKFGSAAMTFASATSDYIDTPDSTDFTLGTGDFTIDFWFNTNGLGNGTTRRLCGQSGTNGGGGVDGAWHFTMATSNAIGFNVSDGTGYIAVIGTTAVSSAGWHHAAGVRTGNLLRFFLDGVQEGGDVSFTGTVRDSAGSLTLGRRGDQNASYFPGLIDEFRLSVGVARWTANFTPPTIAYGYDLTASTLAPSSPVLDSPAASVFYALTATGLTTASPDLASPVFGYELTASDLTTGSPVLDTPSAAIYYPLTASDLTTGSPAFGSPSASVFYALTASDLTTGSPVLGTPSMSTGNQLTPDDLETGSPDLATPSASVFYPLTATGLATGSPVLDTPAASVFYALTATGLTTGSPVLDTPALYIGATALDLATGAPALDSPAAAVFYALVASPLATGSPDLDSPVLMLGLLAADLATGSPVLDTPALTNQLDVLDLVTGSPEIGTPALTYPVLDLVTGSPDLDSPTLSVHYALTAADLATGSPDLDSPILFISLLALDLETGSPDLDRPVCSHAIMPRAEWLIDLGETLLDPIYQSMISVPARVFPQTPGLPAIDLLAINHTNGITVQFGIGVQTVRPAVDVRVRELATYGVHREDMTGGQVMLWPDTDMQEVWNIETVFPRPGIWGEPSGELRLFLMDRQS